jgi:3',5'-cyclic AMP phosphodiesterase CpdA
VKVTRREFSIGAMASALAGAGAASAKAAESAVSARVRFLAFADMHYAPGVFTHDTHEWLERVLGRADSARADFVIHAGDFTHDPVKCPDYMKLYNDFRIPTYHTLGNHDTEGCTLAQTLDAYGMTNGYYHFDRNGFRFVVLDTNHFRQDGGFVHFEGGNYRKIPHSKSWTIGEAQYEWAEDVLKNSPYPCVVFMHQSCERESGGVPDWARMRGLFRWVNKHKGPKVRLVINGHHHTDAFRFIDGIPYLDLNSANYKYYAQRHKLYPAEYHKTHRGAGNVIAWDEPISAVITMDSDGYLKIEGRKAKYLYGVSPEKAKFPKRDRPIKPEIQSIEMTVKYS